MPLAPIELQTCRHAPLVHGVNCKTGSCKNQHELDIASDLLLEFTGFDLDQIMEIAKSLYLEDDDDDDDDCYYDDDENDYCDD